MTSPLREERPLERAVLAGVCALVLSACGSGQGSSADPPAAAGERGAFGFEILQWRCRHANVVTPTRTLEAKGEFCLVALNVSNEGDTPASVDASCQLLLDGQSGRYTPDTKVMEFDELAVEGFGKEIGPGQVVENSALYYDVPKGTDPVALELHETCEGPGVRLPLDAALKGADRVEV